MTVKAGTAYVEVQGDFSKLEKDIDGATRGTKSKFMAIGKAAAIGLGAAATGAALVGPKLISLASDAEETASKFKTVFGREAKNATAALDAFSKATGTSKFALREQAAQFQALVRPMGLTTEKASDMSLGMTKLATDLASFNNTSVEEAITALQSGLVGEAEPLRKFGVQLSAARVEAFAYSKGIAKAGTELTAAQKAQASYGIILEDTKLAQGDATKTAGSFANQWKRLKNQATDLATELGVKLLPAVTKIVGAITGFIGSLRGGDSEVGGFGKTVGRVFKTVRGVVEDAVDVMSGWFKVHRDDLAAVGEAIENVATAVEWAWEKVALPVVKRVLPAIQQLVEGAFKAIGGAVDILAGLLTGDFGRAWDGVKALFSGGINAVVGLLRAMTAPLREVVVQMGKAITIPIEAAASAVRHALGQEGLAGWLSALWNTIRGTANLAWDVVRGHIVDPVRDAASAVRNALGSEGLAGWLSATWNNVRGAANTAWDVVRDHIVDPIRSAVERVHALIGNAKDGLVGWLAARWGDISEGVGKMRDGFVGALHDIKDLIVKVVSWVGKAIDAVKSLVGWVGKIKVPDITPWKGALPFGGEGNGTTVGPAPSAVQGFDSVAGRFGLTMTSGYRPGDDGWHGQNRARDYSNSTGPTPQMLAFAKFMAASYGSKLKELIYTPLGFGIKNGQKVPNSFYAGVLAGHYNHVHVAMKDGGYVKRTGWALVGEEGPELARLPSGTTVYPHGTGPAMGAGMMIGDVYIGGEKIDERVEVRMRQHDRQAGAAFLAGARA